MFSGAHRLLARAVVHHRCPTEPWSTGFSIALLTSPPEADGAHAKELEAEGYQRQSVSFGPPATGAAGGRQLSAHPVSFRDLGREAANVTHAAIYDAYNRLVAYSFPERIAGAPGPGEVLFPTGEIQVRF